MRQVRQGLFETNSSSSHAIFISNMPNNDVPNLSGKKVFIDQGEFGWQVDKLTSWKDKASYLLTWAVNYGDSCHVELLREAIKDTTKAKEVKLNTEEEGGFIDHQSYDVAKDVLNAGTWEIKNLLFNRHSFVELCNDNM